MTGTNWRFVCGIALAVGMVANASWANGFRNPPETGEALSRDGGKLTSIKGAAATAVNPANLLGAKEPEVVASLTLVHAKTDFDSALGSATTDDPWKALPNAFLAFPVEADQFALGVGLTTPFGQSTEWKKDGVLRYSAPYFAELKLVNVNPTIAYRVHDRVAVGAGVDVFSSTLEMKQFMPWSQVVGNPAAPDGEMKFDGDGSGVGWNVGVQVKLTDRQQVGLVYRSGVKVDYDGDFSVGNVPAPALASPKSDFSSEIEFPAIAALGYGIQVNDRLHLGADVEWIEFSRFDALPIDIGVNNALLPTAAIPQNWDDTWTYGVSAAYTLNESWVARAGYKFMESPIPDSTLAPTLPDADRHLLSAGLGYQSGRHHLDLAYAYSIFDDRTVSSNLDPALNGTYELASHLFVITYGIQL